jgi:hypothetical protein
VVVFGGGTTFDVLWYLHVFGSENWLNGLDAIFCDNVSTSSSVESSRLVIDRLDGSTGWLPKSRHDDGGGLSIIAMVTQVMWCDGDFPHLKVT